MATGKVGALNQAAEQSKIPLTMGELGFHPLTPRFTELFTRPEDTFPKTKGGGAQGDVAEKVRMLGAHAWEVGEQEAS